MKLNLNFFVALLMVVLAIASRFVPHPMGFAPIVATSLFGAAYFTKHWQAYTIPLVAMWISDLLLNNLVYSYVFDGFVLFYDGCFFTYLSFVIIALAGSSVLTKVTIGRVVLSSLAASVVFFLLSNFGTWYSTSMYPSTFSGLIACYTAGLPFFKNALIGDLVYCGIMFGAFEFMSARIPQLSQSK
ncbi:MAG: hypothetical protein MJ069_08430 [Salinivirgaceae bacterium]|nr:hypothetical protein [Salinivirgaceae bacterium]